MHDVLSVEILQCRRHLRDVLCRPPFWELLRFPKVLVQFTLPSEFEYQEYPLAVVEVTEEPENVRMRQIRLDLDLTTELLLHLALLQLRLVQDLQCAHEAARLLFCEVYATEFALS